MNLTFLELWKNKFNLLDKFLFLAAVFFSLLSASLAARRPYVGDFLMIAIPALYLSLLALKHVIGRRGILLFFGLLFCAGGDIALALDQRAYFELGIGLFIIGHLFYIATFLKDFEYRRFHAPVAVALGVFGCVLAILLVPRLGDMKIPVLFYLFIIFSMSACALFRRQKSKLVFYGSLLFIFSDSMIALNRFYPQDEWTVLLIMPTYYLAQFFIAGGYLFDPTVETGD